MGVLGNAITAAVALLGVLLGSRLSFRNQDRLWWRDHDRQWRDIRLSTYNEFLSAFRQYVAFTLEPSANITSVPHPRVPGEQMPFFDETGRSYKEKLEATFAAVRLVSELPQTVNACVGVVTGARQIAAARAVHSEKDLPSQPFQQLWSAEQAFMVAARLELGLPAMPRGPNPDLLAEDNLSRWSDRSVLNQGG